MKREEAIKLMKQYQGYEPMSPDGETLKHSFDLTDETVDTLLSALRHQEWEEQLWHDAKSDPPKTPGLYYGKKDATNSMYACQYRDGVWVLDMYPQQMMDIVQWADYTAFVRGDD